MSSGYWTERQGKALKEVRKRAGFSQEELGDLLGATARQISRWEIARNEPPKAAISELIRILGASAVELHLPPDFLTKPVWVDLQALLRRRRITNPTHELLLHTSFLNPNASIPVVLFQRAWPEIPAEILSADGLEAALPGLVDVALSRDAFRLKEGLREFAVTLLSSRTDEFQFYLIEAMRAVVSVSSSASLDLKQALSAHVEYLVSAWELPIRDPDAARLEGELLLQLTASRIATGYSDSLMAEHMARVESLLQNFGTSVEFRGLEDLWQQSLVQPALALGRSNVALSFGERMLRLADNSSWTSAQQEPLVHHGSLAVGQSLLFMGDSASAEPALQKAVDTAPRALDSLYVDTALQARCYLALAMALRGDQHNSIQTMVSAVRASVGIHLSNALANVLAADLDQILGNRRQTGSSAKDAQEILGALAKDDPSAKSRIDWRFLSAIAEIHIGWVSKDVDRIDCGIASLEQIGVKVGAAYWEAIRLQTQLESGKVRHGAVKRAAEQARLSRLSGDGFMLAELQRLCGQAWLKRSKVKAVEYFTLACEEARSRNPLLHLRAARDLLQVASVSNKEVVANAKSELESACLNIAGNCEELQQARGLLG